MGIDLFQGSSNAGGRHWKANLTGVPILDPASRAGGGQRAPSWQKVKNGMYLLKGTQRGGKEIYFQGFVLSAGELEK